jgi:proteic killer suppression protein
MKNFVGNYYSHGTAPCLLHETLTAIYKDVRWTMQRPNAHRVSTYVTDMFVTTFPHKPLDTCHATRYNCRVIKTSADKHANEFYATGKSRRLSEADLLKRAMRRLEYVDLASRLEDLKVPPSNRLHALKDDREGQYSISINDQWRICFRFKDGDAYDVEITDYH